MAGDSLGKADYFDAGFELLASGGVGAVTIAALCYRLGVTKGSFYHHFSSQTAFQNELLAFGPPSESRNSSRSSKPWTRSSGSRR